MFRNVLVTLAVLLAAARPSDGKPSPRLSKSQQDYCGIIHAVMTTPSCDAERVRCVEPLEEIDCVAGLAGKNGIPTLIALGFKGDEGTGALLPDGTSCGNGFRIRRTVWNGVEEYVSIRLEHAGKKRYRYRAGLLGQMKRGGVVEAYGGTGCGAVASGDVWKEGETWLAKPE